MSNESIITDHMDYCLICNAPTEHRHHGIEGVANRKKSDREKLIMPLCARHHTGNMSVHMNKEMNVMSHIISQLAWEREYCIRELGEWVRQEMRSEFIREFGKSFL